MKDELINILYIDDEVQNLQSFKASFRKKFNIYITTSIAEAELILAEKNIHIVFADQRMPGTTGVEFFESIRQQYPEPIRILMTGYTDITSAIDAINKGGVFRFINKPWDYNYVLTAIEQAYDIFRTRRDLHERNQELRKAYEELDKFVYSASHDLRAPLMSILGIVQLALLEDDKAILKEYLSLVRQSVHKLDKFIINVIDYYKNARGTPVIKEIDFNELVTDVIESIQYLPDVQTIDIRLNISQPETFKSDIFKLRMILNNIITNAIKFQDNKKEHQYIQLDLEVGNGICHIRMEDNGVGIKDKDIANVFEMFYRGRSANSGSGIGLYIVREAIVKLGGSIKVNSEFGKGTMFELTIPSAE